MQHSQQLGGNLGCYMRTDLLEDSWEALLHHLLLPLRHLRQQQEGPDAFLLGLCSN